MSSILFVAAEGLPFIKTGGLADVIGSLPKNLVQKNYDVRVVLPLYKKIALNYRPQFKKVGMKSIKSGIIDTVATYFEMKVDGVVYYFIEHQNYFERDKLYGYDDDGERFAFFQRAAIELLDEISFYPKIMHTHDWHTGMIPALCKIQYGNHPEISKIKHVYTIHNLAFKGNYSRDILGSCFGLSFQHYQDGSMRYDGGISFMKTGIVYADKISTVSPTYSYEILTPEYGEKLEEVLKWRKEDLWGIVNGIDIDHWNSQKDESLVKNYTARSVKSGKKANKLALQKELGLREAADVLLVGMVSRLTYQKGISMILEKMSDIMGLDIQLIVLGSGEEEAEQSFKEMEGKYRRRAVYYCGYNEELAHRIYAGSDLFLMPSLYEPCGLSQLLALRYGSLPLVRETGGLKDTVHPFNQYTNEGNGFSFWAFNKEDMYNTLRFAADTYYTNRQSWDKIVQNAMNSDVSWEASAKLYEEMYDLLLK